MNKKGSSGSKSDVIGQVFTPPYIAEFMVKNCKQLLSKEIETLIADIEVLEPAVGEGIFLEELIKSGFKNITAYELDLTLKRQLLKRFPAIDIRFDNFLGASSDKKYDLIIGNPPYLGQNYNAEVFQEYVKNYDTCEKYFVGNMDLFYFFIHLGIEKLKPGGILCFITTHYWITKSKKTGIKYLKPHIIRECNILQYIDLSEIKLFQNAQGQHNCIFILQKKNAEEKSQQSDKKIKIIQLKRGNKRRSFDIEYNREIFTALINNSPHDDINIYDSGLSNNDLKGDSNWNLLYPKPVKKVVDYIERLCYSEGKLITLGDLFIIRNGIIFIKDDIFILTRGENLKIMDGKYSIKIDGKFITLTDLERKKLKKIYKSKSIQPYSHSKEKNGRYGIYFNKQEFEFEEKKKRNQALEKRYPNLIRYLQQHEGELRAILINAKEDPEDLYFPRRGSFINRKTMGKTTLLDLEPLYDEEQKIFLSYISKTNKFGFSSSSYYATSDTYFLWAKNDKINLDYPFLLAYLNSYVVKFLFNAKNIKIKRSKTKLEAGLPVLNLQLFRSQDDLLCLFLIRFLSSFLMGTVSLDAFDREFYNLSSVSSPKLLPFLERVKNIKNRNEIQIIQEIIDDLLFFIIELNKNHVKSLFYRFF